MSEQKIETMLDESSVNIRIKLSGLWATSMFLYIYVDYFGLFIPGVMQNIIAGEVAHTGIQISQTFLVAGMTLMMIPSLMIFLSLTLKAKVCAWANIVVGILQICLLLVALVGETWVYYIFATVIEIVLLLLIVRYAWQWPKQQTQPNNS